MHNSESSPDFKVKLPELDAEILVGLISETGCSVQHLRGCVSKLSGVLAEVISLQSLLMQLFESSVENPARLSSVLLFSCACCLVHYYARRNYDILNSKKFRQVM